MLSRSTKGKANSSLFLISGSPQVADFVKSAELYEEHFYLFIYLYLIFKVPPSDPKITDETGREIRSSKLGPLKKKQWAVLQCHVMGGKPSPEVEWYTNGQRYASSTGLEMHNDLQLENGILNDQQTDANTLLKQQRIIVREIRIGPLNRSHQDAQFTCRASNSLSSAPKTKTVILDIQCKF